MAHTTLYDVRGALPDAQDTELFDFVIPTLPGGTGALGRNLAILCQQAIYPGRSNEIMEVPIHGTQLNFAGRAIQPRTMSVAYAESSNLFITRIFQQWFEEQRSIITGTSNGYKANYAVDGATLFKYDTAGVVADVITFYGLQPEDMPDQQLDGSSTNLWVVNMTFRYDFYLSRNVKNYRQR